MVSHPVQKFAVWFGGSVLSSTPEFFAVCKTTELIPPVIVRSLIQEKITSWLVLFETVDLCFLLIVAELQNKRGV